MSLSVYMAVEMKRNGKWEKISMMVPDDHYKVLKEADFAIGNGCHDIFTMLGYETSGSYDTISVVQYGLPEDVTAEVKEAYDNWSEGNYFPRAAMVNLADLHVEILENPKVIDYETSFYCGEDDENIEVPMTDTPLTVIYGRAKAWLTVWTANMFGDYQESDVRIIGWVM